MRRVRVNLLHKRAILLTNGQKTSVIEKELNFRDAAQGRRI